MIVAIRALVWSSLFVALVLVWLPAQALEWAGFTRPAQIGPAQVAGAIVATAGAALTIWCIATFVVLGRGTPAPFDPPQRLVVRGPYRFVRNPMYWGAALAIVGAALSLQAPVLLGYGVLLLVVVHCFVVGHEEPSLKRTFGADYEAYCRKVRRWWPAVPGRDS